MVRFYPPSEPPDNERLNVRLTLRPSLPHPDLSRVISDASPALRLTIERENGRIAELVDIDGKVDPADASRIEEAVWEQQPQLKQLIANEAGHFLDGTVDRMSRPLAVSQLLIAYQLLLSRLAKEQLRQRLQAIET